MGTLDPMDTTANSSVGLGDVRLLRQRARCLDLADYHQALAPIAPTATLPTGTVIDADAILLALAHLHLLHQQPINPLTDIPPLLGVHKVRYALADRYARPWTPSDTWLHHRTRPGEEGHKVLLDRLRKLHAAGLAILDRPYDTGGRYWAQATIAGITRAIAIAMRTGVQLSPYTDHDDQQQEQGE